MMIKIFFTLLLLSLISFPSEATRIPSSPITMISAPPSPSLINDPFSSSSPSPLPAEPPFASSSSDSPYSSPAAGPFSSSYSPSSSPADGSFSPYSSPMGSSYSPYSSPAEGPFSPPTDGSYSPPADGSYSPPPNSSPETSSPFPSGPNFHFPFWPFVDHALEGICSITQNPTMCISFLGPFSTGSVDATSSLKTVIQVLLQDVKHATAIAQKFKDNSGSMLTCVTLYLKCINDLQTAEKAFTKHQDLGTAIAMISDVVSNFNQCKQAFDKDGGQNKSFPMEQVHDVLTQVSGFGTDIYQKLINQGN